MKLGDIVTRLVIDPRKLTEYALNPDNPVGADKAVMLQRPLGFTRDNYQPLLEQILAQTLEAEAISGLADEHGQRYRVDLEIIGTQGQREIVRTAWIVEPDKQFKIQNSKFKMRKSTESRSFGNCCNATCKRDSLVMQLGW